MNDQLIMAICALINERLRRQGCAPNVADEIAVDAIAEFWCRNPEFCFTILCASATSQLVVGFSKLPTQKAKHAYYQEQKSRESRVQTIDFALPENDRFYDAKNSPALLAEKKDALAAIKKAADELGPYRGADRYRLALAKFGAESFVDIAAELNVGVDAVRRAANATLEYCERRLAVS